MNLLDLLKGKKVNYMTDAKVVIQLEISKIKENHHSREINSGTQQNDWYPEIETWTTIDVEFINGLKKTYRSLSEIDIVDPN